MADYDEIAAAAVLYAQARRGEHLEPGCTHAETVLHARVRLGRAMTAAGWTPGEAAASALRLDETLAGLPQDAADRRPEQPPQAVPRQQVRQQELSPDAPLPP